MIVLTGSNDCVDYCICRDDCLGCVGYCRDDCLDWQQWLFPQDIDKCVAILEDLAAIPVNPPLLRKNPNIMATIKKCRKFKKSAAIQQKAEIIYHKFKSFFLAEEAGKVIFFLV